MTTSTTLRDSMIEYYNSDPNVMRLQSLELAIRDLHQRPDFKASSQLIRESEKRLSEGNLADTEHHGLEAELTKLRTGLESVIRKMAVHPPLQQRIYAEWDEESKTAYLLLPFPLAGILDGLSIIGLSRWYAKANPQLNATYLNSGWGGYAVFEINNLPNLSVVHRALRNLKNPPEFEMLNIHLNPALTIIYSDGYRPTGLDETIEHGIIFPPAINPQLRNRYLVIIKGVEDYFDEHGAGVRPIDLWRILNEGSNPIPESKLPVIMRRMVDEGYLKRDGIPGTTNVRYFPLRAVIIPNR